MTTEARPMTAATHPQLPYTLRIGRRPSIAVRDLADASSAYQIARDESGEGASTFSHGTVVIDSVHYTISYNGRVWLKNAVVLEAQ
jgi:hypothetical protein